MASRPRRHRPIVSGIFPLLIAWLALTGICQADSPVYYFGDRTFEIPFSTPAGRTFRRIHLHVSTDAGKTYSAAGSTIQRQGAFSYTARDDGWYFFIVQIEEMDGRLNPARLETSQPSMRIYVDTVKPKATLRQAQPKKNGTVAVEWSVSDETLDVQSLRLHYRAAGAKTWIPLSIGQLAHAQFEWNPPGVGPFEVRLLVSDKAQHTTETKIEVRADPSRAAPNAGTGYAQSGTVISGDRKVIYVNRKSFNLNYNIEGEGPSKVKQVEIWLTRDTTSWTIYHSKASPRGPHQVTVPAQGRYGFTLRPISGVGRGAPPPRAGDLPQLWVEVDETAPVVRLHNVVVNEGMDANTITVNWHASDKFFGDTPITIYYSTTNGPEAQWHVLQDKIENTGTCKCPTENLPFEFYVRIEAVDRAGNKASDHTRDTIKVDLSVPKVIDVNVTIDDGTNPPPH